MRKIAIRTYTFIHRILITRGTKTAKQEPKINTHILQGV